MSESKFQIGQMVSLKSNPSIMGVITKILQGNHETRYEVFHGNSRFYILLKKAIAETDSVVIRRCEIVRVQSGDHISGSEAFFPDEENKKNKNSDSNPRVKSELLRGQRKQGVREFLESIGVKEVGKEDELKYILCKYYSDTDDTKNVSDKQHITHMKKFVSFWKSQEEEAKELLSDYAIFSDQSGESPRSANELYMDMPYLKTGLKDFFENSRNIEVEKYELWHGYRREKIKYFEEFAHSLGVMNGLEIVEKKATWTQKHIFTGRSGKTNRDYFINGLKHTGSYPLYSYLHSSCSPYYLGILNLDSKNVYLSKLIWFCISKASPEILRAIYETSYTEKTDLSFIMKQLKDASWMPDKDDKFRKPSGLTKSTLHKDFTYDDRNGWLTAIGFSEDEKKKTEEYKNLKTLIKKLGVSEKYIDLLSTISQLPKEQQDEAIKDFQHHIQKTKNKTSFPEKESADPERRSAKLKEKLADAPEKGYEVRERSVRTTSCEIKPEVKTYLRNNYSNGEGEMICQICEKEMPFKLDDGSHYFEAVECIKDFPKECRVNYLALCPICAAKYKYANASKPEDLRSALLDNDNGDLSIPVTLAREDKTIRFVRTHLNDLRAILGEK